MQHLSCEKFPDLSVSGERLFLSGFLAAVILDPWGPVPRYAAWLVCLIGIGALLYGGREALRPGFGRKTSLLLLFILFWSAVAGIVNFRGVPLFLKGVSIPLEGVFGIWAAAVLVTSEERFRLFLRVWAVSAGIVIFWTLYALFSRTHFAGPFSNINSLGNYANIVLPVALYSAFRVHENSFEAVGDSLLFWGALAVLFMSLTSSSWMTGAFQVALFLVLARPPLKKATLVLGFAAGVLALSACVFVYWHGFFGELLVMEWQQLASLDDPVAFTNNRWTIWKGTLEVIRMKPFIGWGWEAFEDVYGAMNPPIPGLGYPSHAHSMYLGLLASGGVALLVAVVALFMRGLLGVLKGLGGSSGQERLLRAALAAVIAGQLFLGAGGSIFEARHSGGFLFWCLMGVALALAGKSSDPADPLSGISCGFPKRAASGYDPGD